MTPFSNATNGGSVEHSGRACAQCGCERRLKLQAILDTAAEPPHRDPSSALIPVLSTDCPPRLRLQATNNRSLTDLHHPHRQGLSSYAFALADLSDTHEAFVAACVYHCVVYNSLV